MYQGRALPHLGLAGSFPADASVQIRQAPTQLDEIAGEGEVCSLRDGCPNPFKGFVG